jgi:hypothetical protein
MPPGWKSDEREGFTGANSGLEQEMDRHLQNGHVSADTHVAALLTIAYSH